MQAPRPKAASPFLVEWGMVCLIFAVVLLCYWPALHGAILWDDPAHVPRPEIQSWSGLLRMWTDARSTQQYYPVLFSAFWFEHRLWGDDTLGYHLVNVFLHATSCCLLALILRRLWSEPTVPPPNAPPAGRTVPPGTEWFAALIFAVHPVCVESVAWITEQKNTLSLALYLVAGLAYLNFNTRRTRGSYALASAMFLFALGAKTVTTTLPAALLVVLWWKHGKLSWRRDVRPLLPWLVAALAMGLFTSWVERKVIGAEGGAFEITAPQRLLLAGRVLWFYLGKLIWPVDLMFFYPRWDMAQASLAWLGWLAASIATTAGLWILRHRTRGPLAGWLFFAGSLFPVMGFFKVYFFIFSYVNDHFQYLPCLGVIATSAAGVALLLSSAPTATRIAGRGLCGVVLCLLAWQTNRQSRLYQDNVTLFQAAIAANPDTWMGHHILGFALAKLPDRHAEAIAQFQEALRLNPEYPDAHLGLGVELAALPGRKAEAIAQYEQAVQLRPVYAEAHINLGVELAAMPGRLPEAMQHFRTALSIKPKIAEAHADLADTLLRLSGPEPEVIAEYEESLRLRPDYAEAHFGLAKAFAQLRGRNKEAIAHLEEGLSLAPDSASAHVNLANLLAAQPDRQTDALQHYEAALRLKPNFSEAHANLANLLTSLPGRLPEALTHYEMALQIDPSLSWVHRNLAIHLSQIPGREMEAVGHGEEAIRLKPDYVDAYNMLAIIYAQQGRLDRSKILWTKALQIDGNYETARKNLLRLEQMENR